MEEVGRPKEEIHPLIQGIRNAALFSTGERALVISILDRALTDLEQAASRANSYRSLAGNYSHPAAIDAAAWINSNSESHFSFIAVCHILNLNPTAVRDKLKRLKWLKP